MFFCCCTSAEVETTIESVESAHPVTDGSPGQPSSFKCNVKRDDGRWGASLDGWDDCIQILDVQDGRIQEYNNSAEDQKKLSPGDFIVQVDGKDVAKETLAALKPMMAAEFSIARPMLLRVRIEQGMRMDGMGWGMKLNYHKTCSKCLRVGKISEGGMAEFNKIAEVPVRTKDFIVEVNGRRDDPEAMLEIFKGCDELDLTLMRLP